MAVTSNYSDTYTRDIVTVREIGARGAICVTSYGAEIGVQWGANLPSPIPQLGERWYVQRISASKWAFESKITGSSYNLMKYSMSLDMWSTVGRERSTVDDIADSGVSEVYLTVAEGGIVYWDSEVAAQYGLSTCDVNGEPQDYVRQVVNRCIDAGMSVVFVIDCNLWSDTANVTHNYYQQLRLDESYVGTMGWYSMLRHVWNDTAVSGTTWGGVKNIYVAVDQDSSEYVATWSFLNAKEPVRELVVELYERYADDVRGVCFRNWCVNGMYADVSDFVAGEFERRYDISLIEALTSEKLSARWWSSRLDVMQFYSDLQVDFIADIKDAVGAWPISVIVPSKTLCLSSERTGRLDTWLNDDFSTYGWSKVGCPLVYSRSVDKAYELRSFEFLVAILQRFAEAASPLYIVEVQGDTDYVGLFNVLAKYNISNVLLDGYDKWRLLSNQQVVDLKEAMNSASVTPLSTRDELGFYLSSNSRDEAYYNEDDQNLFQRAAQDFCITVLDKLPHRLRIYYDDDLLDIDNTRGLSALVLFQALNMDYDAVSVVGNLIDREDRNVTVVGRCGMYPAVGTIRRVDLPLIDKFGEVDLGVKVYEGQIALKPGRVGAFSEVYAMDVECVGINPTRHVDVGADDVDAIGMDSEGNVVAAPIYFKNRSTAISIDVLGEPSLMQMAAEMVLLAIGRNR